MNRPTVRFTAGRDNYELDFDAKRIRRLHHDQPYLEEAGRLPGFGFEEYARLKVVTHDGDGYALVVFWDEGPDGDLCILAPLRGEAANVLHQFVTP